MYKITILDKDKAYLERLVSFLKEHHGESFAINIVNSLDDLDMKVVQCNALFFGDDITVDDALFPADIAIGYLTEAEETGKQYINKYQSMEQIYRRMLTLCETGKTPDTKMNVSAKKQVEKKEEIVPEQYDLKSETIVTDGETYRVYHVEEALIDGFAVRMLTGNRIEGLFETKYRDGELRMRITGMKSLYEYVTENNTPKGKGQLLKYLADMLNTALSLEEYMLSADKLMLNPREICVDAAENRVLIPYLPLKGGRQKDSRRCLEEIRGLCNVLLSGIAEEIPKVLSVTDVVQETSGSAEEPDTLRKNEKESKTLKKDVVPYIVRKRTKERIFVNRSLFKLGKETSYVDYCIKDNPAVSRNHADIVRKPDGYYLVDRGSLNHTFVNGKKLAADEYRKLEDGCLMQLADEVFEFHLKQEKDV